MASDIIHDRGRGPEIAGTRITVYNLLQSFLDPSMTESEIAAIYELSAQQIAAARAYVLAHADTVLAEFLEIEQRLAAGNPPEVQEQLRQAKAALQQFQRWLAEQNATQIPRGADVNPVPFPTFREWLAARDGR